MYTLCTLYCTVLYSAVMCIRSTVCTVYSTQLHTQHSYCKLCILYSSVHCTVHTLQYICASGTAHLKFSLLYANQERVNSIHEKQALLLAGTHLLDRQCFRHITYIHNGTVHAGTSDCTSTINCTVIYVSSEQSAFLHYYRTVQFAESELDSDS